MLLVSDPIAGPTGLGRITRELALRIRKIKSNEMDSTALHYPLFDLATAGYGNYTSKEFPIHQYTFQMSGQTIPDLPTIWFDHAGEREGIIFFVWNASWLPWFANPESLPEGRLKSFLKSGKFKKWIYAPVDAMGPNNRLSEEERQVFAGFDEVLAYTNFGAQLIDATMASDELWSGPHTKHIPHGTDRNIFFPRDKQEARKNFIQRVTKKNSMISGDIKLIGVVATNSARKDWPLAFETCAKLLEMGVNVGLWAHMDRPVGYWNLPALAESFGMKYRTVFSNLNISDEDMSWAYAACDCTLGIGSEGWGYPISESLACGVPCVTGEYAGQTEFTPPELMIRPKYFRYDGLHANMRPIFDSSEWSLVVKDIVNDELQPRESLLAGRFYWENCWPCWEEWLKEKALG